MIQIAICDDSEIDIVNTEALLSRFFKQNPDKQFELYVFRSSLDLLQSLEKKPHHHIYLLDIIMPGYSGITLGEKIREQNLSAIIIYLSSSPDYALDAFHVYAFQYLLKPLLEEKFFSAMDKALVSLEKVSSKYFMVKTKEGFVSLSCIHIQYIEYSDHIIYVYMNDGLVYASVTLRESFDKTIKELQQYQYFVKPHKSFLVNLNYVQALQEHDFVMKNYFSIPISRNNYAVAKKQFIDFLLKKNGEKENVL